jgi:hypothetical protein
MGVSTLAVWQAIEDPRCTRWHPFVSQIAGEHSLGKVRDVLGARGPQARRDQGALRRRRAGEQHHLVGGGGLDQLWPDGLEMARGVCADRARRRYGRGREHLRAEQPARAGNAPDRSPEVSPDPAAILAALKQSLETQRDAVDLSARRS